MSSLTEVDTGTEMLLLAAWNAQNWGICMLTYHSIICIYKIQFKILHEIIPANLPGMWELNGDHFFQDLG